MKKTRESLETRITNALSDMLSDKKKLQKLIRDARDKFDVPEKISSDYITLRKNVIEADTFMLFILTSILFENLLPIYFTDSEIEGLTKAKWHIDKISFPLSYNMTKITDEQYIGKISVKELMLLKDAQLINYNENAQRTMNHIVKGETEYYQIALNKEAVSEIMESYNSDLYIPNTITLNLPEDADYDFDDKTNQLIIKNVDHLDILDGYHRYIAISKICALNPDFDYDMELRIVQFVEGKAKRFIWQEDQKTRMRKIDSDSLDTSKYANKVVERMNNDTNFILAGKISRNKGIINAAELSNVIDVMIFKKANKTDSLKLVKEVSTNLMNAFEDIAYEMPMENKWDKLFIYMVCYETQYGSLETLFDDYWKVKADKTIYKSTSLSTTDITRTHKLLGKRG